MMEAQHALSQLEAERPKVRFWRKQQGIATFIICLMGVAVLVMWLIVSDLRAQLGKCGPVAWDPPAMQLPPTEIRAPPAQPAVDL